MPTPELSAEMLINRALADPTLIDRIKADPGQALPQIAAQMRTELPAPLQEDVWIYRIVVGSLGLAVLGAVFGAILLAALHDQQIPELLTAVGSAAVGALAGLLSPSPVSRS